MRQTLLTVFTYGGAQEMVDRHYPYWERSGCDILLSFPTNDGVRQGGIANGLSQKYGPELITRTVETLWHVLKLYYKYYWFIEGDAVVLGKLPVPDGLEAFAYKNDDPSFFSRYYYHWGWGFTHARLAEMLLWLGGNSIPFEYHRGFPDRWLGAVLEASNDFVTRTDVSFSCNRIDTPELVASAKAAIANGARIIHGVKTQADLDAIGV